MLLIRVQGWVRQLSSCMQVAMSKYSILTMGVAVVNIGLLFAIGLCFRQMDAERLEQIRARAIITECDALSKSFHDAGVAMGGYSITRSPFFADRYNELSGQILNNLEELKALIGEDSSQQALLSKVKTNTCEGLKLQGVCKATVDAYKPYGTHCAARPEYKQMRLLADQLKSDLNALTAVERDKVEAAKRSPSSATILVYSLLILSALLNAFLIVFLLLSKRQKDII